jgi:hypothetical protein
VYFSFPDKTYFVTVAILCCTYFSGPDMVPGPDNELNKPEERTLPMSDSFRDTFSTDFCLTVLATVLESVSLDFDKKHPVCYSAFQDLAKGTFDSLVDLQSVDKLMPYEQLWQDIVHNLNKSPDTATYIYVTRSEVDHLEEQLHDQISGAPPGGGVSSSSSRASSGGDSDVTSSSGANTVLFTCGHYYTKKTFMDDVLVKFNRELSQGPARLPESVTVLTQYYSRQGLLPLACPRCVLNALHATV